MSDEQETLLALDLASVTGWCVGPVIPRAPLALEIGANTLPMPKSGSRRIAEVGCDVGRFLHAFDLWLEELIEQHQPNRIFYESPIFPDPRKTTIETLEKLYGASGHLRMIAHRVGVPVQREQPSKIKKSFCGSGAPGKQGVLDECKRRGWKVVDDNHADALAVYYFGISEIGRERKRRAA